MSGPRLLSRRVRRAATRAIVLLLALAAGVEAFAQEAGAGLPQRSESTGFVHEVWTVEDGLPVNAVNVVLQSRDGYIWAATFDGLVRFDGVRFSVYNAGNTPGLPSNRIVDLVEGRDGALWLRTEQFHLVRFADGAFTHVGAAQGLDEAVFDLMVASDGSLWIGTDRGIGVMRGARFVPVARGTVRHQAHRVYQSRDGAIWVGTSGGGLYRIEGGRAERVPLHDGREHTVVRAVSEDGAGTIWIGTQRGVFRWPRGAALPTPLTLGEEDEPVFGVVEKPGGGAIWVVGEGSMYRVDGDRATRIDARHRVVFHPSILQIYDGSAWFTSGPILFRDGTAAYRFGPAASDDPAPAATITSFIRDREGSFWIGTHAAGLHRLKPSVFTVWSEAEGLSYRNVYPVHALRSGAVLVGTWGMGLSRIESGRVTNHRPTETVPPLVRTLLEDRAGRLWIGTHGDGLVRCASAALDDCAQQDALPGAANVFALHEDAAGNVWVGADVGLFRWSGGAWTHYAEEDGAPSAPVRAFLATRDGAIWMGTNGGGVSRFLAGRFRTITSAQGLPSDLVRSLYEDARGFVWVGTEGRGLARLDARELERAPIVTVRARDGLFDEVIHQMIADDHGRLWMSTNRGIFWVSLSQLDAFAEGRTRRIRSIAYTERDGLRNREANGGIQPAGARTSDGRLWFPTQDGVAVVDPARIQRNRVPPPVVIERVTAGDTAYRPGAGALRLGVDQRNLEITYTGLSFVAPENVSFRYRLEGYDADWIDAGNRRTAFYTRVPPGDYTFRVTAANEEGVWNDGGAALALVLAPRFYETAAFRVLALLALALLVLVTLRWRERQARERETELRRLVDARTAEVRERERRLESQNAQLEAQAEELSRLDRARSRFFANVSHEFRTPLTLTIGPLEDARVRAGTALDGALARQLDMALRNARRLLRLVNQIMDVARLEAGHLTLRPERADLVTFVRGIAAAFAPLAEQRHIVFEVTAEPPSIVLPFDADALEKVVTNLLSNAFKFTPEGGAIRVSLALEGTRAQLRVADSGPGIPAADLPHMFERFYQADGAPARLQPGTGIGLSLAKDLVELHGGRIEVESTPAGASFLVELPLGAPANEVAEESTGVEDDDDARDVATLLVVDDNADMRAYVRSHFEPRYRVLEAADGAEGITMARAFLPDLVISDVVMPGTDGHALARALRESPDTDFIPLVLLTARGSSAQRIVGLEAGADDYVVKPFEMRELEARVDNLIASRRRLRERGAAHAASVPALRAHGDTVSPADAALLERVRKVVEARLADGDFGVSELANEVFMDRSHLYRRLRTLLGETPSDLIRRLRLERAADLLGAGSGTVAEVAYASGFNSVSYFCHCFREAYGLTPAEWRAQAAATS